MATRWDGFSDDEPGLDDEAFMKLLQRAQEECTSQDDSLRTEDAPDIYLHLRKELRVIDPSVDVDSLVERLRKCVK
jgi:hypothetical protein